MYQFTEKFDTLRPNKSPKRILKSKLLTALGATGANRPYPGNTERIIERKIIWQNPGGAAAGGGGGGGGGTPNGLLLGLVHYYQLQEAAANFIDSKGPTDLSWLNFGADFTRVAGFVNTFAAHYSGAGASNGITTGVGAPFDFTGDSSGNTSMTFLVWFNMSNTQPQAFPPIFAIWSAAAASQSYLFRRDAANQVGWYGQLNAGGGTVQISPITASDNNWHMFVGGHDHANGTWWAQIDNGARVTTPMATLNSTNATPFVLFNWSAGSNEIQASISDMGIWNGRVLSLADVTNLWNGGAGLKFSLFN